MTQETINILSRVVNGSSFTVDISYLTIRVPCDAFNNFNSHYLSFFQPNTICRYVLDSAISHLGVVHISIQVWRALWNILTHTVLPGKSLLMKSYLVSLGAGYGLCFILFALQHPLYLLARKLRPTHWVLEHALEVFVKIKATGAAVLLWRGGWGLCRDFLLKDEWQFWLAHSCGVGLLIVVQASGTIGIPSIAIDCEFGWGTGQYYPVEFFLQWYYKRIYRKLPIQVTLICICGKLY